MKLIFVALLIFISGCKSAPIQNSNSVIMADVERKDMGDLQASGTHFAISTQGIYATKAARKIFEKGGNIIDAAIAASFVVSVERPQSTGLSGGGFMLYREAKTGKTFAIDFRERAPLKATENMYIGPNGGPIKTLSRTGILAAAVPGLVAGLVEIQQRFGHLPLKDVIAPAIELADKGFPIYSSLADAIDAKSDILKKDPAAKNIFLDKKENPLPLGHLLVQKDLAHTLRLIATKGRAGFYKGFVADHFVKLFSEKKGLLTQKDLDGYQVKWRKPVVGHFHGNEVYSMPPPSSGGIHVIQFLNILQHDHLAEMGVLSTEAIHLAASALQLAFADRAKYLGDPDFTKIPLKGLVSQAYADSQRKKIPNDRARKANEVSPGDPAPYESTDTTHISIMDSEGNAVSTTQTVNGWLGAGIVVPETGVVLNNEMDDFSAQENTANMYGAIGGKPNSIAPKKTPLSSMSPTILVHDGSAWLALGAPGGTRIISCVAQTILNRVEFNLPLVQAISIIRYHDQWKPDELDIDPPGPKASVVSNLKKMGYDVKIEPVHCDVMAVEKLGNTLHAVADPRDIGTSSAN